MTAPVPVALPFGMRDVKLYPYLDAQGTILADEGFDLPYAQTLSFADSEQYTDLRGDDELVATHGNGAQVNWTLEAGGISLQCWAIFTGGQIIETGTAPNRVITLRKLSDDARPYFKAVGQIMSDSGGDVQSIIYRAKCNGDIKGQFADGQFFVTSADGIGLPMPGTRLLYDIAQHESQVFLTTTPEANPILPPRNIGLAALGSTSATLVWEPISGMTGYRVQISSDDGDNWTSEGPSAVNEVQTISITGTPTSGTWVAHFMGVDSAPIQYNAIASAVQTALQAMSTIGAGNVTVTGGPGPGTAWVVTFAGDLVAEDVPLITTTATLAGGTSPAEAVVETTKGVTQDTDAPLKALTSLTADEDYLVRIASKIGTDIGQYSPALAFHTLPA